MTDQRNPADPGVEGTVARPAGVSYLHIPAQDVTRSAEFYRAVFGWELGGRPEAPSFRDGTGHVIGHWRPGPAAAGDAGIVPYVYVDDLDGALSRATGHGAPLVTPPYLEGSLRIATIRDPGGNVVGIWESGSG